MYIDKKLVCKDCGAEFLFTAGEQEFYAERGLENEPQRCRSCRMRRKHGGHFRERRVLYEIVCSKCGKVESIPFEPSHDRPVFCNECYRAMQNI